MSDRDRHHSRFVVEALDEDLAIDDLTRFETFRENDILRLVRRHTHIVGGEDRRPVAGRT